MLKCNALQIYLLKISKSLKGANGEVFNGAEYRFKTSEGKFSLNSIVIEGRDFSTSEKFYSMPRKDLTLELVFSEAVDTGGIASQFTLAGNCAKGRRPSFDTAATPDEGQRLYDYFVGTVKRLGLPVETGIFQADMKVHLVNDGPVTFILEK